MESNDYFEYIPATDDEEETVGILMPVYQHENYVGQAIESVLMQKTKYKYKLYVGEDCSKDRSRSIILDYQKKNPDKISVILWKKNSYSIGMKNGAELAKKCHAKYIAHLEGDDFWIATDKLEKQIDILEHNPEYYGCTHNIVKVDENNRFLHKNYSVFPYRCEHIYTKEDAKNFRLPSQTASMVYRNFQDEWNENMWNKFLNCKANGDVKKSTYCGMLGNIYYLDEIMSAYRCVFNKGSSFNASLTTNQKIMQGYFNRRAITDFLYDEFGEKCYIEPYWADQWTGCKTRVAMKPSLENIENVVLMFKEIFNLRRHYKNRK